MTNVKSAAPVLLLAAFAAVSACAPKHEPPPPAPPPSPETARAETLFDVIEQRIDEAGKTLGTQARADLTRATEVAAARMTDAATERDLARAKAASRRLAGEIVARAENVDATRVTRLFVSGAIAGLTPLWPYTEEPDVGIVPLPPAEGDGDG